MFLDLDSDLPGNKATTRILVNTDLVRMFEDIGDTANIVWLDGSPPTPVLQSYDDIRQQLGVEAARSEGRCQWSMNGDNLAPFCDESAVTMVRGGDGKTYRSCDVHRNNFGVRP